MNPILARDASMGFPKEPVLGQSVQKTNLNAN